MAVKYIFITGGVVSSLGKGITAASIGCLLKRSGLRVNMIKLDPYINVDPGTMNPYQHGEVYVTSDGAETDMDLGHYERFLGKDMSAANNATTGSIYSSVIDRERNGGYLGDTVQVIPHVTDEIKTRIKTAARGYQVLIVEIGGTVGDIESLPYLEAIRQMSSVAGKGNVVYIHLTLVPFLKSVGEIKTKPTQQSAARLREIGVEPDIIMTRSAMPVSAAARKKISLFCNVGEEYVIHQPDVKDSVYEVPLMLEKQAVDRKILKLLGMRQKKADLNDWKKMVDNLTSSCRTVRVGIAGKYTRVRDAYISISEALSHSASAAGIRIEKVFLDVEKADGKDLDGLDGVIVPGGFGERGVEDKIKLTGMCREKDIPFLGICLGLQCMVIDFARNILGLKKASSTELNPRTPHPVISLVPGQKRSGSKGGTMRLGNFKCVVKKNTFAARSYRRNGVWERHRHRYEVNRKYAGRFEKRGLVVSGIEKEAGLIEIMENRNCRWFTGCQFHPEFTSRPLSPNRIISGFVKACVRYSDEKKD